MSAHIEGKLDQASNELTAIRTDLHGALARVDALALIVEELRQEIQVELSSDSDRAVVEV